MTRDEAIGIARPFYSAGLSHLLVDALIALDVLKVDHAVPFDQHNFNTVSGGAARVGIQEIESVLRLYGYKIVKA